MSKYRCEYTYSRTFGSPRHVWTCIGAMKALHVHITDHGEAHGRNYGERYSGGVEVHYRYPPDYMATDPPSQDQCWLLKCPCWHDGSSLQASEFWIPLWMQDKNDHDGMFRMLEQDMERRTETVIATLYGVSGEETNA